MLSMHESRAQYVMCGRPKINLALTTSRLSSVNSANVHGNQGMYMIEGQRNDGRFT